MGRLNLIGQKFGRLEVQEFAGKDKSGHAHWNCDCNCGNITRVRGDYLKRGDIKSCGCLNKEAHTIHGQGGKGFRTKEYRSWQSMKERCLNPKNKYYKNYGGRGIKVCNRWLKFENFYGDMKRSPKGASLDRKDNNGDYEPGNCRWATKEEQMNNTRKNKWYEYRGENRTIAQWERYLSMSIGTLRMRLTQLNWSTERAMTEQVRRYDANT